MMTTLHLQAEVRIPRAVYEAWSGQAGAEVVLRTYGLLPPAAQEIRWRMDAVTAGYVVTYRMPVTLPPQGIPYET